MISVGLTGSIGMGKSATAGFFAAHGDAVIDADGIVHALYEGRAVAPVEAAFPGVASGGVIDRAKLSAAVLGDADALKRLEAIVHPMVREEEAAALKSAKERGCRIAVVEIPLLFETGSEASLDAVVVASAPPNIQRERVLSRPGMDEEKLAKILSRQMPDDEKRRRAHFIIDTGAGFDRARSQVAAVRRALLTLG
ncbi:MAG: dephospho-CoA kinase [Pseudomonadota bacterium]